MSLPTLENYLSGNKL